MLKAILRLTKQSLIYGMGQVLSKAVIIILLPVHTNKLLPEEYGAFNLLLLFIGFMAIIYSFGLNTAFLQFYILEPDRRKKDQYFATAFLATLVLAIGLSLITYSFRAQLSVWLFQDQRYQDIMAIVVGILSLDAFILLAKNILRAEEKSVIYGVVSLLNVAINCGLNIQFVVKYGMGLKGILFANLLASGITFMMLLPLTIRHMLVPASQELLKKMLKFGLPFLPSALAIFLIDSVDRKFIEKYLGMAAVGIYGAGYKISLVIKLFINAFNVAWVPFFLSLANEQNAKQIFAKVMTYFTVLCSLIFLFFAMFMQTIVRFRLFGYTIVGKEYWASLQIVPVVILAYIFFGFYLNFQPGAFLTGKTKYFAHINVIGAGVNILANMILIPWFGLMGAAYATLIAYFVMAISLYLITQRIYPIEYEQIKLIKIGLITGLIVLLDHWVKVPFQLIFQFLLLGLFLVLIYVFKIFDAREIRSLKGLINKFYGKISFR
ncbi:MAG: oligosaccharide flippase family protein [candidate division KSB1 bacterium]|nr:oligosaccharide flippase family protein [candidate division KSB1 bacterium]MDZ7334836.1 oligosaccharide flippase family protein [candidate division KSB1 bacterium]MDZ7356534.1 oligosaccharide flippase family protein [candidate division KSB1 bacterium]MDZ7400435.1 oligosaccharide flippase family protein [candidate division KSB1 bacterium]